MKSIYLGLGILIMVMVIAFYASIAIHVPAGSSLMLRYKGPIFFNMAKKAKLGSFAENGEVGVQKNLLGPGRYFYSNIWWEKNIVSDILILPGQVGVVTSKIGQELNNNEFLVDGEIGNTNHKGVLRKCLGPGLYRINPYGYQVEVVGLNQTKVGNSTKTSGWVDIPTGFVGVVTNLTDIPRTNKKAGIQNEVLPPGLYLINPKEQQLDIIGIGYWETSINIQSDKPFKDLVKSDEMSPENMTQAIKGGIQFPSSDGFNIVMDFTAIWGLMPDQAANAIRRFGNIELVEAKVVMPQIESICRNNGSEYSATQLLVGEEREVFQNDTLEEFKNVLNEKEISLVSGSVKHIYIPQEVRKPIQMSFISDELRLTRGQEELTTKEEGNLREAEKMVDLESARIKSETIKLVAERKADGAKKVAETEAETRKLVAAIERQTAELQTQASVLMAKAESEGKTLVEEAKADKFKLAVEAFGTPAAYNKWTFAENLPNKIEMNMIYSGSGTLWTDLNNALRVSVQKNEPPVPAK